MIPLWKPARRPWTWDNVEKFANLIKRNPDVQFYLPNAKQAPWHVQAVVNGWTVNFWPHLLKGNRDGETCRLGFKALDDLIEECRGENSDVRLVE